jgi:hypothetical protein
MKVQNITSSAQLNNILNANNGNLSGNMLYVLGSGDYIVNQQINLNSCSAIIGSGNVTFYSSLPINAMFYIQKQILSTAIVQENIIIDNIKIDGKNDGQG